LPESPFAFHVGVDWGTESHQVCVLDAGGQPVSEFCVAHSAAAIREFCARLAQLAPTGGLVVAIESPTSPVTEPLLEAGFAVFSINPKQLDRFRDRYFPAGSKDDRRDSFILATSVRTDPGCFRRLDIEDPKMRDLRALSRLDQTLKTELGGFCARLRDLLLPSFPALLALCPGADEAWLWELLSKAPTAPRAARLSCSAVAALLKRHRIRRIEPEQLVALLRQPPLPLPQASFQRSGGQIMLLLPVIAALAAQRRAADAQIQTLLEELSAAEPDTPNECQHRDLNIIRSLPGVGTMVAATMLAEAHQALARRDYHALRAHAGVAPITRQSGKSCAAFMRHACNPALRQAVYHWSRIGVMHDPRCKAHYKHLRERGHSHGRALRGVADRLLKMLCSMLKSQTPYDPQRRQLASAAAAA